MDKRFEATKVSEHVYWVGAVDRDIRDFHGYKTNRGSTYNAYLVTADKITLIDTVKAPFRDEMLSRVASVVEPGKIDYIVSNHSEMDHSGSLPEVIEIVKPEKVFASVMGAKALAGHFHMKRDIVAVEDGGSLDLGGLNLLFMETRMLHWPDSMFSYLAEDKLLFSQDAFGMHLATSERYADEIAPDILEEEALRYFANILTPYSALVLQLLEKVAGLDIAIDIVAPDHGPIWRKDLNRILELYARFAAQKPTRKAVVVYDTMWHSTEAMARAIADGLQEGGAQPRLMPLRSFHRSDVAAEVLEAGALLVGSPTLNNNVFPTVADVLTYIKGLRPQNLVGAAFGSYGWSGEAARHIAGVLKEMKVEPAGEPLNIRYVPDGEGLEKCGALGLQVAQKLQQVCGR